MEFRKLIQFGGNSFVISLPKKWIEKNKLNKGDAVYVDFDKNNLVLSCELKDKTEEKFEVILNINNESKLATIRRRIFSAYVKGATDIVITGKNVNLYSESINDWLKQYVALEVIEQTSNKIVAKTYVDAKEVDIVSLIKRIDNTVKSMMVDLHECSKKNSKEKIEMMRTIIEREENIDKIARLLYRIIQLQLLHPELNKNNNPLELLRYWQCIKLLEQISNEIEYIVVIIKEEIEKNKKTNSKGDCIESIGEVKVLQDQMMVGFYKNDINISDEVSYKLQEIMKQIKENCVDCSSSKKQIILNILNCMRDLNRLSI